MDMAKAPQANAFMEDPYMTRLSDLRFCSSTRWQAGGRDLLMTRSNSIATAQTATGQVVFFELTVDTSSL
jgi:hypothetical protein